MDEPSNDALADVTAVIDEMAECLVGLSEQLHDRLDGLQGTEYGPNDAAGRRVEDGGKLMRAFKRELATLIRDVEGPNPPQAPRNA